MSETDDAVPTGEDLYEIYLDAIHDVAERWQITTEEAERWLENQRVFRAIRGDYCV